MINLGASSPCQAKTIVELGRVDWLDSGGGCTALESIDWNDSCDFAISTFCELPVQVGPNMGVLFQLLAGRKDDHLTQKVLRIFL